MSVSKKGKRKICVKKENVWSVSEDYDSPYYILNICSMEISNEFKKVE